MKLYIVLALALTCAGSCSTPIVQQPDLARIYDRVAMEHHAQRRPVVLIPGVLGSNLTQEGTDKQVWGAFRGDYADPNLPDGARLIALPLERGKPLPELADDVVESGALSSLSIRPFGIFLDVSAYLQILSALGVGGYRDEALGLSGAVDYGEDHFTCFQFSYDWRRELSETAARLETFLKERRAYLEEQYAARGIEREGPIRFDIVAHSMGGLVLRYFLRYGSQPIGVDGELPVLDWRGAEYVDRGILVGTPNAGAALAFIELLEGKKIGPTLPRYGPAILGSMPAVYELLPRSRHGFLQGTDGEPIADPRDPQLWSDRELGLLDPNEDRVLSWLLPEVAERETRRAIAEDHVTKCLNAAERFHRAMDEPAAPPPGTQLFLVAGDAISTPQVARLENDAFERVTAAEWNPGDGTVLRSSALMDERINAEWTPTLRSPIAWSSVLFFFSDHLGLTREPAFIDNLLFLLLEQPRN